MKIASRLQGFDPQGSVFSHYTGLANKFKSVNLGQGFPNLPIPPFITQAFINSLNNPSLCQYTRSEGHPALVNALAKYYASKGLIVDPTTQIITTVGASEGIFCTIQATVDPGDQVLLIAPFYDSYPASIALAGGLPVPTSLTLKDGEWTLDMDELESKVSSKTKMILINNPHNPTGKVFSRLELQSLAEFAEKHDLIVLADEVYETLVYNVDEPLVKFASLPGMFKRTVTVGSAGKMFGVTGWKVGWLMAPTELTRAIWMVHQFNAFCVATPLQEAVAVALESSLTSTYFQDTISTYAVLRDSLFQTLESIGFNPSFPKGAYFIVCDIGHIEHEGDFSTWLTSKVGVTCIPVSAFYLPQDKEETSHLVRFAFCKDQDTLKEAHTRLTFYFSSQLSQ